jgi:hypothetical protein
VRAALGACGQGRPDAAQPQGLSRRLPLQRRAVAGLPGFGHDLLAGAQAQAFAGRKHPVVPSAGARDPQGAAVHHQAAGLAGAPAQGAAVFGTQVGQGLGLVHCLHECAIHDELLLKVEDSLGLWHFPVQ